MSAKLSQQERQALKAEISAGQDDLLRKIPKVELHVHVEGTMTPELRWRLARRHGVDPTLGNSGAKFSTIESLKDAYKNVISSAQSKDLPAQESAITFFEAYYSGFQYLKTKADFFDLAMNYFQHAADMNIRYCEVVFDPQGHTSRGVSWDDMMGGLREAKQRATKELNVQSSWIMCFLRDQSPEDAMSHYKAALQYKDMILGVGLDSNEHGRPPSLFEEIFAQARKDGFKITAHCDVGVKNTYAHIRQVASTIATSGLDRIDHGLNAADDPSLVNLIASRNLAMTICPWAYLKRETYASIAERIRILVDAGIKICIGSDDPPYMDDSWVTDSLLLVKRMGGFTDTEMTEMVKNSVQMCWASDTVKRVILEEIDDMVKST